MRKTWNITLNPNVSILSSNKGTNQNQSNVPQLVVVADFVWTDNSGSLLFANNSFDKLKKAPYKEIFKILGPGLWLSVDIGSEEQQNSYQDQATSEDLAKKIRMEFKKGYKYQGLSHLAAKLGKKTNTVEWELSQMIKAKKLKLELVADPQIQKTLEFHMPDILKKYPDLSQESIIETLKMRNENHIDYIQLSIWLVKKGRI